MKKIILISVLLLSAGHSWAQSTVQRDAYGLGVHMDQFGRPVTIQPSSYGNSVSSPPRTGVLGLFQLWQQNKSREAVEEENKAANNWIRNYQVAQSQEERLLRRRQIAHVVKNLETILYLENYANKFDQNNSLENNILQNQNVSIASLEVETIIVGTWHQSVIIDDNNYVEGTTIYNEDNSFFMRINFQSDSNVSNVILKGDWMVDGDYLLTSINQSSLPDVFPSGLFMKDKIISIGQEKMVTLSESTNSIETAFRVNP